MESKPKLLIFTDWYTPAFKAGGPIRSVVNMVDYLKNSFEIYVFTSDRDLHDTKPFDGIITDQWIEADSCKIYYHSPGKMNFSSVKDVIKEINPDKIYLNSMFSNMIYPLLAAARSGRMILAPRGMLKPSALAVKPIRKFLYLSLLKTLQIEQNIVFHATSEEEKTDIQRIFPLADRIVVAPNLPVSVSTYLHNATKKTGEINIVFVGRIHPIKNLLFLLDCVETLEGSIQLDIVATMDDQVYWKICEQKISGLPENIKSKIHLNIPHHQIKPLLEGAHLFVLPTEGENFGHAIFESLAVGCPVIVSDQTPWRELKSKKAGVDLPLSKELFLQAIQDFVDMADAEWQEYRHGALLLAKEYTKNLHAEKVYNDLFNIAELKQ